MYYEQKTCLLNKFYLKDFTVNNYKGYTELDCYKHGRELRKSISLLVSKFPKEEKYELASQIKNHQDQSQQILQKGMDDILIPIQDTSLLFPEDQ